MSEIVRTFATRIKKSYDMANADRANRWLEIVAEDMSVADDLFKTGHWLYVGFMCHQVIEKALKAYWCICRDDDPPYIHDHKRIAEGCGLYTKMDDAQKLFLTTIRQMNIEARYQEYKDNIAVSLDQEKATEILGTTKKMYEWILQKFSEKKKH